MPPSGGASATPGRRGRLSGALAGEDIIVIEEEPGSTNFLGEGNWHRTFEACPGIGEAIIQVQF